MDEWLTRAGAATALGLSNTSVRRLEDSGELSFQVDEAGIHWFRSSDVEALRQRRGPRRAACGVIPISPALDAELEAAARTIGITKQEGLRRAISLLRASVHAESVTFTTGGQPKTYNLRT